MRAKQPVWCECVEKVNALIKQQGATLVCSFRVVNGDFKARPIVATERYDSKSRVKLTRMIASFCPFCGKEYPDVDAPKGAALRMRPTKEKR